MSKKIASAPISQWFELVFGQTPIQTFYYARLDSSGKALVLSNKQDWVHHKVDNGYSVFAPMEISHHSGWNAALVPEIGGKVHNLLMREGRELFNIHQPFDLVRLLDDGLELFSFAAEQSNTSMVNYYFSSFDLLKKFSCAFSEKLKFSSSLVWDQHMMHIDNSQNMIKYNNVYKAPDVFAIFEMVNLSSREKEVLELVCRGYTMQEIAQHLYLSDRTIESHINTIKMKLKVSSKKELVKKFTPLFI